MLKKLACSICILLVIVVASCNNIPQSDYNNLLAEYDKVLKEKLEFEQKCDNLTQQREHIKQELDATREELINIQAQLEEMESALQNEKSKETYILKPSATLPDEMKLEPYEKRLWKHFNDDDNVRLYGRLASEIRQYEASQSMLGFPPWYAIERLDGTLTLVPRQDAWELYKMMEKGREYQDNSLFVKLVQLGCIPYGSEFIPEKWERNEYYCWNAISPECLEWMESHMELADGNWIAGKYLEMIKEESDVLYDIIITEGYGAYENAVKSISKNN